MERLPIPTGHPDYEITPEEGGWAVIHKCPSQHGGMGAIRFASTEQEAMDQLESMKKANGDA